MTTAASPFISVVIPTCDRPEALASCLDRLAPGAQSLGGVQYEVVVTDDGATEVSNMVASRFQWARWVRGPRRGPAANRNAGARAARGTWVAFTDDDCLPDPGWLESLARAASGPVDALEGKVVSEPPPASYWEEAPTNAAGGFFWSCNIAIRRDLFERVGEFDEAYRFAAMEDVDLRLALNQAGARLAFVEGAVINHPRRRVTVRQRLGQTRLFESHVYFERKWSGRGPLGTFGTLLNRIVRHWFKVPYRRAGPAVACAMFIWAVMRLTTAYPLWYARAGRLVRARRSDVKRVAPEGLPRAPMC